jgi:hypothetical protein
MAASAAVAGVLTGHRRRVEVAAATPHAIYLATGDPECPALCLVSRCAVRVPCALLVPALPTAVDGTVGGGVLSLGPNTFRVTRWWRPARPRGLVADRLGAVVDELSRRVRPEPADPRLLGYGEGLTPWHDDVLAGALVTLGALGSPGFDRLGRLVRASAPARTTFVSAALLHHAARGECIRALHDVLTAPRDGRAVAPAVDTLLGVGHSSGRGLAAGVLGVLAS